MNADLIAAAVLFGPAAIVGPPLLIAAHRTTRHSKAVLAMLAQERAKRANDTATETPRPPDGGQPAPGIDTPAPQPPATGRHLRLVTDQAA